ncbi:DUF11 domain-containing protein [Sphingomonas sp. SRS2]|uniref:DUF11 domain-containing protein n=1 Tax=Sphingomonas sp. SRS2 TaxID=133190 RepID=UPI0006184340|nr:DUF11 domain-containing protein [Sphingomonas sp. SRS2]KKC27116.1 hypothetical protein WP12_04765 [Sphingomonas sp. SRS2]
MKRLFLILMLSLAGLASAPAGAALTVSKSSVAVWDPYNKFLLPKAIPGGLVEYTITVSNALFQSTARNVTISDAIPAKTKFYVGSVSVSTLLTNVTYTAAGGLEYSRDNGTSWNYTPSADADGGDASVTNIRVTTGGSQLATQSFSIVFRVIVK